MQLAMPRQQRQAPPPRRQGRAVDPSVAETKPLVAWILDVPLMRPKKRERKRRRGQAFQNKSWTNNGRQGRLADRNPVLANDFWFNRCDYRRRDSLSPIGGARSFLLTTPPALTLLDFLFASRPAPAGHFLAQRSFPRATTSCGQCSSPHQPHRPQNTP